MASTKADRKFMEAAMEQMRVSRSEHRHKHDPLVGAILVGKNGRELAKTHRGSLRVGNHAEYTLIERLLGNKNLEGAALYVTLEPCTVRESPKQPCVKHIHSARIGKVWIGMLDPNPDIQGEGIKYLQAHGIEVDFFDNDLIQQIHQENKNFIEQYEQAEEVPTDTLEVRDGSSEIEKQPVLFGRLQDFSPELIRQYLAVRGQKFKVPSNQLWDFFLRNGFVVPGEKGAPVPTVAGILLLGKTPEDFLPQCKIKIEAHRVSARSASGGTIVDARDLGGALSLLPFKIQEFLTAHMRSYVEIRGLQRVEVPEYPWEALREPIVNSIAHRDYREGAHVIIQRFSDCIVIKSPGALIRPVSLAKIRAYNAPPYSRNPRIADTFWHMKLMEERGWGLPRMRDILASHGYPPPQFHYEGGYFVVTFHPKEVATGGIQIAPDLLAQLEDRQKKMIDFVREHGKITRTDCVKRFKVSAKTATRELSKLVEVGILEKREKGPATHYVLVGT
jgi:ATP-dependent DNA helicase RecG